MNYQVYADELDLSMRELLAEFRETLKEDPELAKNLVSSIPTKENLTFQDLVNTLNLLEEFELAQDMSQLVVGQNIMLEEKLYKLLGYSSKYEYLKSFIPSIYVN